MRTIVILCVLSLSAAVSAFAGLIAPEISASSATGALALLSGGLLVLRGRKKR
jgi:LPXTG-motif cell wall-anchored protein